jgi:hypothetical protein
VGLGRSFLGPTSLAKNSPPGVFIPNMGSLSYWHGFFAPLALFLIDDEAYPDKEICREAFS